MKATLTILCALLLAAPFTTQADSDDALWGALVGGALGVIVGENSSDIRTEYAVPAFAALGALATYANDGNSRGDYYYDRNRYSRNRYDPYNRYGNSHYRHFNSGRDYHVSYPHWPRPIPHYRPVRKARAPAQTAPRRSVAPAPPPPNLHPGVTIVRVPVQWPNGIMRHVRILRVNGRYVGPQGEPYDSLPDAEALAERYVPKS